MQGKNMLVFLPFIILLYTFTIEKKKNLLCKIAACYVLQDA